MTLLRAVELTVALGYQCHPQGTMIKVEGFHPMTHDDFIMWLKRRVTFNSVLTPEDLK